MTDPAALARPTFLLLPLAFVNFAVGAGAFLVIGMLSPLAQSLSMSKVQAGWVMSAYALGYALTSPVLIALTGRLLRFSWWRASCRRSPRHRASSTLHAYWRRLARA